MPVCMYDEDIDVFVANKTFSIKFWKNTSNKFLNIAQVQIFGYGKHGKPVPRNNTTSHMQNFAKFSSTTMKSWY